MNLGKFSMGIGDRFGHQGAYQLEAIIEAKEKFGVDITPVWNKSNREHQIVGTKPADTRLAADNAVKEKNWKNPYFVDADHINLTNVDGFIDYSNFFTLDVADYIGEKATDKNIQQFVDANHKYIGDLKIPGIQEVFHITENRLREIAAKFLFAIEKAGDLYRHIESKKGKGNFVTEVSMDEVDAPQTPIELFFILSAIGSQKIPAQTIAPKFTGRFNKGVDYVGDVKQFGKEFEEDLLVIDFAVKEFGLPSDLKLSVHSGSDKFSIYPVMSQLIKKYNKGIHLKTAGTTWLEELIGLAMAGKEALTLFKQMYSSALDKIDALCKPYATVIDINIKQLPTATEVNGWSSEKMANTLRHIPGHPDYNPNFRQLMHVSYKLAAEKIKDYSRLLVENKDIVGKQVKENVLDRHIKRIFI
jgi:tagaturonate epimerase